MTMDDKEHYWHDFPHLPRLTVLPWLIWAFIIVAVIWATGAFAAPLYKGEGSGITVVLTDEPCRLAAVTNLKHRATWTDKEGKVFEGCWSQHPEFPIVIAYFDDKTVAIFPVEIFERVRGA